MVLLIAAGGAAGILLIEIGLRAAGLSYPYFYVPDPILGYAHQPGAEGWWRKEGAAYVRISRAGFRDREHTREKPKGVFRIAVLGDSFTEALQVPIEQTYWAIAEGKLKDCPSLDHRGVEVLNFGVSGYGTAQEWLMLQHKVWDYAPDLIVLAFFTGNDIRDNSPALAGDSMRPYFVMHDGRLSVETGFRQTLAYRMQSIPLASELFEVSRVLQVAREAKYRISGFMRDRHLRAGSSSDAGMAQLPLESFVYLEPREDAWRQAWLVTEALLGDIRNEIDRHGAQFLLVTLSNPMQVHPDLRQRRHYAETLGIPDLLYPDRRLASWAEREHVQWTGLAEPMAAYAATHQTFLHGFPNASMGDGHWNEEGHRVASGLMAEKVCSMQTSVRDSARAA